MKQGEDSFGKWGQFCCHEDPAHIKKVLVSNRKRAPGHLNRVEVRWTEPSSASEKAQPVISVMNEQWFKKCLTFYSTYALDPVTNLHVVTLKWHEDSIRMIGLTLSVNLWIAMLELKPVIAIVLSYFAVHFKIFFHPAEGHIDLAPFSLTFNTGFIIYQAIDFFKLGPTNNANNRRGLWRLWRVLLVADASIPHLWTWSH